MGRFSVVAHAIEWYMIASHCLGRTVLLASIHGHLTLPTAYLIKESCFSRNMARAICYFEDADGTSIGSLQSSGQYRLYHDIPTNYRRKALPTQSIIWHRSWQHIKGKVAPRPSQIRAWLACDTRSKYRAPCGQWLSQLDTVLSTHMCIRRAILLLLCAIGCLHQANSNFRSSLSPRAQSRCVEAKPSRV